MVAVSEGVKGERERKYGSRLCEERPRKRRFGVVGEQMRWKKGGGMM